MGYKLRCDLSKTAVYQLCQQYVESVQIPKLRDCIYKKSHGIYWLSFSDDFENSYEVCFAAFAGSCHIRVTRLEYYVPFEVLLSGGYLREVA